MEATSTRVPVPITFAPRAKRPEALASELRTQIITGRFIEGTFLGSQTELIEQMNASRGSALEAMRLLEHQGLIELRRGPNGGVFVAKPQARNVVSAVAGLLGFEGVTIHELQDARIAIEPLLASDAAASPSRSNLVAKLQQTLAEAAAAIGEHEEFSAACHRFHAVLAQHAENRPLGLFAEVLQQMTHADPVDSAYLSVDPAHPQKAHTLITAAIEAGDAERAHKLMLRHLDAARRHI